jgi:inosose dehydratase
MTIRIGNAPCSWGVEFADDPRNPPGAGAEGNARRPATPASSSVRSASCPRTRGTGRGAGEHGLELIGGVVFRAFHDPGQWDDVLDGAVRTCKALKAHGAQHLVLIDSISPRRAPTAGRADEAEQMDAAEWAAFRDRIATVAKMGAEEYGLTVGIHAHAAGFMDFEPELERLLDEVDESMLKICFDTGHHSYAGFDPVAFMKRHIGRISLHAFQGHRPGSEGRGDRQPHRVLRRLRPGHLLQSRAGRRRFPRGAPDPARPRFRRLVHGRAGLRSDARSPTAGRRTANRAYLASIGF